MGILRRYNKYQGLKELDVLIDDDAPISQYFNVVEVPTVITQGRSSFLIGGSPLLKDGVELKFEIINDASGKGVVYTEAVSNYRKIMGNTNPEQAEQGTIRKIHALNIQENSVHGSDSNENAEKEIYFFFREDEILG